MNYINICLLLIYIYLIWKYYKKLKETDERMKQNEIDYFEIKEQNVRLECYIKEICNEIEKIKKNNCLHNEK